MVFPALHVLGLTGTVAIIIYARKLHSSLQVAYVVSLKLATENYTMHLHMQLILLLIKCSSYMALNFSSDPAQSIYFTQYTRHVSPVQVLGTMPMKLKQTKCHKPQWFQKVNISRTYLTRTWQNVKAARTSSVSFLTKGTGVRHL